MIYILTSSYCWSGLYGELDVKDFKEKYSDFKIQVSEKINGSGNAVCYNVFIDIETLDELDKFILSAIKPTSLHYVGCKALSLLSNIFSNCI